MPIPGHDRAIRVEAARFYPSPLWGGSMRVERASGWGHKTKRIPTRPRCTRPPSPHFVGEGSKNIDLTISRAPDVSARGESSRVEARPLTADHRRNRIPRRRPGGEADMLVAEREPQARMPRRRSDHRQTVRQRWPRAAPGVANRRAKFDDAARHRNHHVELRERR